MAKSCARVSPLAAMIHLDTNFLIQALILNSDCAVKLEQWLTTNETIGMSAIAWSEFVCGPLTPSDLLLSRQLISMCESFNTADAEKAAELFNSTGRRSRSLADCQIAAVAIRCGAKMATANRSDFVVFESHGLTLI
jgi:predicted nucleic acid-binding protein